MHPEPMIRVFSDFLLESCRKGLGDPVNILIQVAAQIVEPENLKPGANRSVRLMVGKGAD